MKLTILIYTIDMKKKYIITGLIGLALGVGLWFYLKGEKKKRIIKEGTFTIEVDEDEDVAQK